MSRPVPARADQVQYISADMIQVVIDTFNEKKIMLIGISIKISNLK